MTTGVEALAGGTAQTTDSQSGTGGTETQATTEQTTDSQSGTGATEQQAQTSADWFPAERKDYVANKGWKAPTDVLESYTSLEKTLGLPADARADALLVRPKADAKPEDVAAFVDKAVSAYVPETPDGYGDLGLQLGEGQELPSELAAARGWMKEAGVPAQMAPKLAAAYMADQQKAEDAFQQQSLADMKALATEYGDKWGDMQEIGSRAFRAAQQDAGISKDDLGLIERQIGTAKMLKMFVAFGKNQAELPGGGAPGAGGDPNTGGGFRMSAEGAKAKIAELQNDSAFMARYTSPNLKTRQGAIAEMEKLQIVATGGSA